MGQVTILEVVNACRATEGLGPLLTLVGSDDPNVESIVQALVSVNRREQSRKWWFNYSYPTLNPDPGTGEIAVPDTTLEIDSIEAGRPAVQRGSRLYDPIKGSYIWDRPIQVALVEILPFEDCPNTFQELLKLLTVFQHQTDFDADPQKMGVISSQINDVRIMVNSQHTRTMDPNFFEEGSVAAKLYAIRFPGQSGRWDTVKRSTRF